MPVPPLLRLALFEAWAEACQWCGRPVIFADMQVEHIIPLKLKDEKLRAVLHLHQLPDSYDREATPNLTISCGHCNRGKSNRPPPRAPVITLLLERAAEKAVVAERLATEFAQQNKLDSAIALIVEHPKSGNLDKEMKERLFAAVNRADSALVAVTGHPADPERIHRNYHDFAPPEVIESDLGKRKVSKRKMHELLEDWLRSEPDAVDQLSYGFDSPGEELISASLMVVRRVGYAPSAGKYLVRAGFAVEYMFTADDVSAPADDEVMLDLWVEMDSERHCVVSVDHDNWSSFGD
jgi:hypothetical protein